FLSGVVAGFESLRAAGKIRAWGVSNFSVRQMEDLLRTPQGDRCATNQVLYNIGDRGIERDLLAWCGQHGMPVMAYSPLGGAGANLLRDPTLARIGAAHDCSAAAVALAWAIRSGNVIAIPESGSVAPQLAGRHCLACNEGIYLQSARKDWECTASISSKRGPSVRSRRSPASVGETLRRAGQKPKVEPRFELANRLAQRRLDTRGSPRFVKLRCR